LVPEWLTGAAFLGGAAMRFLQALIFLAFLVAVAIFAVQNTDVLTFRFLNWSVTGPVAFLTIVVYLLGMLSGWTVVSFAMRSVRRIGNQPRGL
jgi:lipopolysaccharide assembly protein A